MSSFFSRTAVLAVFTLVACGGGGGTGTADIRSFFPADNEVAGWTRSGNLSALTPEEAKASEGEGGVDGDAWPFDTCGMVQLGKLDYGKQGGETIDLRVWQMKDVAAAKAVWDCLTTEPSADDPQACRETGTYRGAGWSIEQIGDAGQITDLTTHWWLVFRKGVYQVETTMIPGGPSTREGVENFAKAVLAKIP